MNSLLDLDCFDGDTGGQGGHEADWDTHTLRCLLVGRSNSLSASSLYMTASDDLLNSISSAVGFPRGVIVEEMRQDALELVRFF